MFLVIKLKVMIAKKYYLKFKNFKSWYKYIIFQFVTLYAKQIIKSQKFEKENVKVFHF